MLYSLPANCVSPTMASALVSTHAGPPARHGLPTHQHTACKADDQVCRCRMGPASGVGWVGGPIAQKTPLTSLVTFLAINFGAAIVLALLFGDALSFLGDPTQMGIAIGVW